jgi:hypothetical protein
MSSTQWRSRDSSVCIAVGYGLDGPGSIPGGERLFSSHSVQTDSGAHSAFYPVGTESPFTAGKTAEA